MSLSHKQVRQQIELTSQGLSFHALIDEGVVGQISGVVTTENSYVLLSLQYTGVLYTRYEYSFKMTI